MLQSWCLLARSPPQTLSVVEQQFWPLRSSLFAGQLPSKDALRQHVCAGFNYPPSQYQLHLQFMVPPFLPFQWLACLKGVHFTPGRFFPFEYVRAVLSAEGPRFAWVEDESTIEQLIQFYEASERAVLRCLSRPACRSAMGSTTSRCTPRPTSAISSRIRRWPTGTRGTLRAARWARSSRHLTRPRLARGAVCAGSLA